MALFSFKQGKQEKIVAYIRLFELIVIRFVRILLTDNTFIHFFIQGFNSESTIKKILKDQTKNQEDDKKSAMMIEEIENQ